MRRDRIPGVVKRAGNHSLVSARRGTNRHSRGSYACACGLVYGGLNAYERHRADERRAERNPEAVSNGGVRR